LSFFFSLILLSYAAPRAAFAYLIFDQSPPNENYTGAILNTPNFVSFGCTLGLNCGIAVGEKIYHIGVWMKKVGNPKDVRLAVVGNWQTVASATSTLAVSDVVSASAVPPNAYTLTWFDFPHGIVIGERFADNQLFQFQFVDAPGTYSATDYYRVLQHDTNDYTAPSQWCKTGWGCASSPFYWQMDAGPVPLAPTGFFATSTQPETELYADHFDTDPGWTTDEPEHFLWDADLHELHAHIENTPPAYRPNRYFTKTLDIDPAESFSVSGDVLIDGFNQNGAVVFGLYADDRAHENVTPTNGPRIYSKSTLNLKLMSFNGSNSNFGLNAIGQDGVQKGVGGSGPTFRLHRWYALYLRYDAEQKRVHGEVVDRTTNVPYVSFDADMPAGFSPDMRYLGVSMYPDGEPYSTMAQTASRLAGSSDFRIDNVRVTGTASTTIPPTPTGFSNILFIPGVEASRLYWRDPDCLFLNCENQLWLPNSPNDVKKLYLSPTTGESVTSGIYTKDVIDSAGGVGTDIYAGFLDSMEALVASGDIKEFETMPYDWRMDVKDVATRFVPTADVGYRMVARIEAMASSSPTGKVTIVTHSNGGLVAKELVSELTKLGKANLIDRVIMVAAPEVGTPKAIMGLLHGTDPFLFGFPSHEVTRELAENMKSAYTLLPSRGYFSRVDAPAQPVIAFSTTTAVTASLRNLYGNSISTYDSLRRFLRGENGTRSEPAAADTATPNVLKEQFLVNAETRHGELDGWTPPPGVEVIEIVGWGLDTPRGIVYGATEKKTCTLGFFNCQSVEVIDPQPMITSEGDGTVVSASADAMGGERYYVNIFDYNKDNAPDRKHINISEVQPVQQLISMLIKHEATSTLPSFISATKPEEPAAEKRLRIAVHSPVSLDVYDSLGRHTGPVPNPDFSSDLSLFEEQIPNSYYWRFGEGQYAGVSADGTQRIRLQGKSLGTFTLDIETVTKDTVQSVVAYEDIPVTASTTATVSVGESNGGTLALDVDGDGATDVSVSPGGLTSSDLISILKGLIKTLNLGKQKEAKLLKDVDKFEKALAKEYKNVKQEKRKTAKAFEELSKIITAFTKKSLLTSDEASELLEIIEKIKMSVIL
jgi:pimeloyl-ACP methyl ester carboxylesterase